VSDGKPENTAKNIVRDVSFGGGVSIRNRDAPGTFQPDIDTCVILTASELLTTALNDLPPNDRAIVEAHFFDGESMFKIQRHRKMRRRDLENMIEAALATMRTSLRSRGVRSVSDVI
jgi:hypothetical protein